MNKIFAYYLLLKYKLNKFKLNKDDAFLLDSIIDKMIDFEIDDFIDDYLGYGYGYQFKIFGKKWNIEENRILAENEVLFSQEENIVSMFHNTKK